MWAMLAVAAASAIAQWYNSEQARNANKEELAKMKELYNKVKDPNFDPTAINPQEFSVLNKYIPETAAYVAEAAPTLLQESQDMKLGREAQLEALRGFRRAATEDRDPAMMAELDLAAQRGQAEAQSRQQSLLQDASRRGQAGSMNTLLMQLKGTSQANAIAAQQQKEAAIEAYRNKMNALRQSAELGGGIRSQDMGFQQANMNAVNAFNQRTAAARQNYLNAVTGERNEAQRMNIAAAQRAADMTEQGRYSGAVDQRNYLKDIAQQKFANEMGKAGKQVDLGGRGMDMNTQNAADRNQAIQSVSDAYMTYQGGQQQNESNAALAKKKAIYDKTGVWPED